MVSHLRRHGYRGRILPIHPTAGSACGLPATARIADHSEPIDLAVILVPAARVPQALDDCLDAGVRAVIIGASGFAETGAAGATRQADLAHRATAAGVRLLGPNCIGTANLHRGLVANFSPLFSHGFAPQPGGLALVSHSGGIGFGIASLAAQRGLHPGWVVTTGNEADVTAGEAMCALAAEPDCTGVIAYLESEIDPRWLARLHAIGKPVAAIMAGTSAAGARMSATATPGTVAVPGSLPHQGVAVAGDVEALLDLAAGFGSRTPRGPRVAVITTSGGAGILAADAVSAAGLRLAEFGPHTRARLRELLPSYARIANPLDVTATVATDPRLLTHALSIVTHDPGCDAILVCFCVLGGGQADKIGEALAAAGGGYTPILVSRTGSDLLAPDLARRLGEAGIGVYPTPARAVAVLASAISTYRRHHRRP